MTKPEQPRRVAIYARYSTEMQNPKSVDDQLRDCAEEAARNGWVVVAQYSDHAMSGARMDRPEFQRLQEDLSSDLFDIVLIEDLDRLSRDQEHTARFYKLALFNDIEVHQLGRGEVSPLHIGMNGAMAALYLDAVSQKTARGMRGRVVEGKNPGGLSYGYEPVPLFDEKGQPDGSDLAIVQDQAAVVRRIFQEYAKGRSPRDIAAQLNADGIPAPRGRGEGTGHWKQNTIYGHRARGTGILNNELYIGRRVWNRQSYRKHPTTQKRVSRLNPPEDWKIAEVPHLRIIDDDLWNAVKARQEDISRTRKSAESAGKTGAAASQSTRRRKYLLSGLLSCGQCGGKLTVAGKSPRRFYYCANAKEKGAAVCEGMPGVRESVAAETILGCLRSGLMQDAAYEDFRASFIAKVREQEAESGEALRRHDQKVSDLEKTHANLLRAVEGGQYSEALITRLNTVDADLKALRAEREALVPAPIELPDDLPAFYRAYVDDLVGTLTSEDIAGSAADELHQIIDRVVVSWDTDAQAHELDIQGKLLDMLIKTRPAGEAGLEANARSLKLVAGA